MKHPIPIKLWHIIFIAVMLLQNSSAFAQKPKTTNFNIQVHDKVSNRQLNRVRVYVLKTDSMVIDSCKTFYSGSSNGEREIFYVCEVKTAEPYYLLRFEREGYKPRMIRVEASSEINLTEVQLEREVKLRNLNEAVVSATKIKMVMKGDTLVYNADAFELGEGSMLDQLISQLSGVKLEKGGVITLNGNKVSSLLINGKDLFNGDVQKAMENLPAYIVDKVKAYQKAPDNAYLTRKDTKAEAQDPWVIDVNLKKDYNQGWLVSAEGGYGTNDRYSGRLFGLRFTNQTELFIYGNANNLNDKAKPWGQGVWYKDEVKNGEMKLYKGGAYFAYNSKNNKNRISTSVDVAHNSVDINNRASQTNYYETGDTYGRLHYMNHSRDLSVDWTADGKYARKNVFMTWKHILRYSDNHTQSETQNATFNRQLAELSPASVLDTIFGNFGYVSQAQSSIINRYRDLGLSQKYHWKVCEFLYFTLPHWNLSLGGNYNHISQDYFSQYLLHNSTTGTTGDYRNRYTNAPQNSYDWNAALSRNIINKVKSNWTNRLMISYSVYNSHSNTTSMLYRLDKWDNGWNQPLPGGKIIGILPSASDSLTNCTDWANSYETTVNDWTHSLNLSYTLLYSRKFSLSFNPYINYHHRGVKDWRNQNDTRHVSKDYIWVAPSLNIKISDFSFSTSTYRQLPSAIYLLDVLSDSDPLFITKGNNNLKPSDTYSVGARYNKFSRHTLAEANVRYSITRNSIGQARYYNSETGVTTMQPANIDGNWSANCGGSFAHELDKKERWEVQTSANFTYLHSTDFVHDGQTEVSLSDLDKSIVRNLFTNTSVAINYRTKPLNAGIKVQIDWQHATSKRTNFTTVNSKDIFTTFNVLAKLPWQLEISTDLTLYNRRGYAEHSMNKDEWIWNASIEKRILKDKSLSFKCTAFDLLAQRSSMERRLNVQGYTETWYNTIPRYVLFTLSYRFHKAPRRNYE